jgi:hypothetical protein
MKGKSSRFQDKLLNPLICCICGDKARGINFSVASCMSCKMFFRRHAQSQLVRLLIEEKSLLFFLSRQNINVILMAIVL